ncbi:MAG: HD domain-containing protein [Spirochaetia bacterium]|nr:HD domain-containing protein [Spirochaetia bacterium]
MLKQLEKDNIAFLEDFHEIKAELFYYLSDFQKNIFELEELYLKNLLTSDKEQDLYPKNENSNEIPASEPEILEFFLNEDIKNSILKKIRNTKISDNKFLIEAFGFTDENQPENIALNFEDNIIEEELNIIDNKLQVSIESGLSYLIQSAYILSRYPAMVSYQIDKDFESKYFDLKSFQYKDLAYFQKILLSRKPSLGLKFLEETGVLKSILPELTDCIGVEQNRFHFFDVFHHSILACDGIQKPDLILRWAALLHDIGKVQTRMIKDNSESSFHNHEFVSAKLTVRIMKRMNIEKETGIKVKFLVRNHMFHYTNEWTDKAVRRFLKRVPRESLEDLITLRMADRIATGKRNNFPRALQKLIEHIDEIYAEEQKMKITDLQISGHDLIKLGIQPGPKMGSILKSLLNEVKDENIDNEKDLLLKKAQRLLIDDQE